MLFDSERFSRVPNFVCIDFGKMIRLGCQLFVVDQIHILETVGQESPDGARIDQIRMILVFCHSQTDKMSSGSAEKSKNTRTCGSKRDPRDPHNRIFTPTYPNEIR